MNVAEGPLDFAADLKRMQKQAANGAAPPPTPALAWPKRDSREGKLEAGQDPDQPFDANQRMHWGSLKEPEGAKYPMSIASK
jgi:hypothetical protein